MYFNYVVFSVIVDFGIVFNNMHQIKFHYYFQQNKLYFNEEILKNTVVTCPVIFMDIAPVSGSTLSISISKLYHR